VLIDTRIAVVGLSLTGALLLACAGILVKAGLRYSDVRQSVLVSFGANALVAALAVLLVRPAVEVPGRAVFMFMADGVLGLLAVSLLFVGIDRVGPTISFPIKNASPILALVLATLFLGELPGPVVYVGAAQAGALLAVYAALRIGMVSVVVPIYTSSPLFVLPLSALFLRDVERVTLRKAAQRDAQDGIIRGRLSQLDIIDLFQALELGRKTCRVRISSGSQTCSIYVVDGQAVHAEMAQTTGEQAVYAALGWSDGAFELDFTATTKERTIIRTTQALLMEGLRLLDEAAHAQDILEH